MNQPEGMIPRVEAQQSHQSFVRAAEPETVMMKITHARRLMRNGESFDSYFYPGVDVITTTTINDTQLNLLPWSDEWEIVEEMEPTFHIPTDYSDYSNQPLEERRENIKKCMEGTVWMQNKIEEADIDTTIVPLLKGTLNDERELCYSVYDTHGFDCAAVYATRYFTGGAGNNIAKLVSDIETVDAESDVDVFLVGLLSQSYLERIPTNVVAAAGHRQWLDAVSPRDNDEEEMRRGFERVQSGVEDALTTEPEE